MNTDNRIAIKNESQIIVLTDNGNSYEISIEAVIGYGGSCIVYRGFLLDKAWNEQERRKVIIKEYYPAGLDIEREENKSLVIPDENKEAFVQRREFFCKGQRRHSKYYEMENDNSLPRAFIYGNANNTIYAISDPGVGYTLSDIDRRSLKLYRIASIMESICKALLPIHKSELLYMDCKPDNFFIYSGSLQDHVYLFDFDTLLSEDYQRHKDEYKVCTYSMGWCAPEQLDILAGRGYRRPELISYSTDIFSIGLIFLWLLGKDMEMDTDKREHLLADIQNDNFQWRKELPICENISQEAIDKVEAILKKMLNPDSKKRKESFDSRGSLNKIIPEFQELYGLTIGDDSYYGSIYNAIREGQEQFVQEFDAFQNETKEHLDNAEERLTEQIKKASLKYTLFGTKRRVAISIVSIVLIAFLFGFVIQSEKESTTTTIYLYEESTATAVDFDNHILLDLENANHQYEVGLENWRRLDYNRAARDFDEVINELKDKTSQAEIETAKINNSMGCLYLDMGRYEEAYDYLNSAFVVFRDKYGETSVEARAVLFSIAQYDYYTGDFDSALQTAQRIIDNSDIEKDEVIIVSVNHFKAMIMDDRGDYQEALNVYQEVLSIYDRYLDDNKLTKELAEYTKDTSLSLNERERYTNTVLWIIQTYNNMGRTLIHMGQYEEAFDYIQSGLDMCLDNVYIGKKNLLTAKLYMNLAISLSSRRDINSAIDSIDIAMRIERNLFDFEDVYPGLVEVYCVYGDLLYEKGDQASALNYYNDALALANETYGKNHLQTAAAYNSRGQYELKEKEYDKAELDFEQAIEIRKNMLCLTHPETVEYYLNMAEVQSELSKKEEALNSLEQAERICEELNLSDEYKKTVISKRSMIEQLLITN